MKIVGLIPIVLLISLSHSFYFGVGSTPLCLMFRHVNQTYHFSYQVNSESPDNIEVVAQHLNGTGIAQFKEVNKQFDIPGHEPLQICFRSLDSEYKSVSIDMWSDSSAAIKQLASKSDIYALHSMLMQASRKTHEIAKQQKFQEERQHVHTEIIMQNEDTIKKYGIAKIIIVILLAAVQIYLFKGLFKDENTRLAI